MTTFQRACVRRYRRYLDETYGRGRMRHLLIHPPTTIVEWQGCVTIDARRHKATTVAARATQDKREKE